MSIRTIEIFKKICKWITAICGSLVDTIFAVMVILDGCSVFNLPVIVWYYIDITVAVLNVVPSIAYMVFNKLYDNLKKNDLIKEEKTEDKGVII